MKKVDVEKAHLVHGHLPVVRPKIVVNVPRPSPQLVEKYRLFSIPDISDAVGQLYSMDSGIRPLYQPMKRLVGTALTVKTPPGDNCSIHRAMLMVQPGDVLVVDARGSTEFCGSGAGSLMPPITRGLAGVVIDGAWRDVGELQAIDFPIYGRGISPFSPPKSRPGEINVPICCGGVIVHPGDIVVCDEEGAAIVPQDQATEVAESLVEYRLRTSLEEWDVEGIHTRKVEANQRYFEVVFEARGGLYIDWNETH